MFAEIHKKVPSAWRNWEDILTGSFFGIIRYTQKNGFVLNKLLSKTQFSTKKENTETTDKFEKNLISIEQMPINVTFWKRFGKGNDEIDLLLEYEDFVIGIEVKHNSGLHDGKDDEGKWLGQLQKYGMLIKEYCPDKTHYLILLAKQSDAKRLYQERENYVKEKFGETFGYISWEVFHEELESIKINNDEKWLNIILDDLINYLDSKGFAGFNRFDLEYFCTNKINLNLKYEF